MDKIRVRPAEDARKLSAQSTPDFKRRQAEKQKRRDTELADESRRHLKELGPHVARAERNVLAVIEEESRNAARSCSIRLSDSIGYQDEVAEIVAENLKKMGFRAKVRKSSSSGRNSIDEWVTDTAIMIDVEW